jgi:hypothetical protein
MAQHFDLIVIGSGPAGQRAGAGRQAQEKRAGGGARAARRRRLRAHRNKDDITAEDLRRRLHITLDHEVEVLEYQLGASHCQPNGSRISCGDLLTAHYLTFLRTEAPASCMRLLGRRWAATFSA